MSMGLNVRLQRTRVEYAYVDVLITDEDISEEGKLDGDALFERALAIGAEPDVPWYIESEEICLNPIQKPKPDHETMYYHRGHPNRHYRPLMRRRIRVAAMRKREAG